MSKTTHIIEVKNLEKSFGSFLRKEKPVISNLSFEVEKSKITGFLGPNGAGKTTTIRIILGFLNPDKGSVNLFEKTRKQVQENHIKRKIGYLPETPSFYPFLKGKELLLISAEMAKLPPKEIPTRVNHIAQRFQLHGFFNKKIKTYSKGMLKKLAFAQALIAEPELLILDEPLTGLDPVVMEEIRNYIKEIHLGGKSLFISSHLLSEMEKICEDVVLINQGQKVLSGNLKELLKDRVKFTINTQDDPEIKDFLQHKNEFKFIFRNYLGTAILKKNETENLTEEIKYKFSNSPEYKIKSVTLEDIFLDAVN